SLWTDLFFSGHFMSHIILLFNQHCTEFGLLAGDFNCVLNDALDRSSPSPLTNPKSPQILKKLCEDTGLIDVWRERHPLTKDYTFYSNPHQLYSRLDYIFMHTTHIHTNWNQ
uniref:Endonuclease/exonuclease/phosphatase domain-containing protein n=1 Tax=Pygocentrus nattereri TaxID=42514 RepID=A0AAR2L345_PYGNA